MSGRALALHPPPIPALWAFWAGKWLFPHSHPRLLLFLGFLSSSCTRAGRLQPSSSSCPWTPQFPILLLLPLLFLPHGDPKALLLLLFLFSSLPFSSPLGALPLLSCSASSPLFLPPPPPPPLPPREIFLFSFLLLLLTRSSSPAPLSPPPPQSFFLFVKPLPISSSPFPGDLPSPPSFPPPHHEQVELLLVPGDHLVHGLVVGHLVFLLGKCKSRDSAAAPGASGTAPRDPPTLVVLPQLGDLPQGSGASRSPLALSLSLDPVLGHFRLVLIIFGRFQCGFFFARFWVVSVCFAWF